MKGSYSPIDRLMGQSTRQRGPGAPFKPREDRGLTELLALPPAMRKDVLKNGLYAKGGSVEVRPTVKDETIQRRVPEMETAAKALQTGDITHADYDKVVQQHKPVKPYTFVPKPASDEDADRALMANKKPQWRGHEKWPAGRKVGLRLDIPAYENHGVWVNSIHDEEGSGENKYPTAYHSVSSVKNATFDPNPQKAVRVATGEQNKSPFARIKGELHHMTEDEAVEHMKKFLNHPDWAQIGMDPRRHGFFYNRKTMKPVTHSAHVVQIGPLVLAHKPTYGKRETYAEGGPVSRETAEANKAKFLESSKVKERLYHGTNKDIRSFDPAKSHRFTAWFTDDPEHANKFVAGGRRNMGAKATRGSSIYPVHLSLKNPLDLTKYPPGSFVSMREVLAHANLPHDEKALQKIAGEALSSKYAGVSSSIPDPVAYLVKNYSEEKRINDMLENPALLSALKSGGFDSIKSVENGANIYAALHPTQIKSAVGNRGTYDPTNPDITKAAGGIVKEKVTISPNMDAMRYELMSIKRLTKKAK